MCYIDSVNHYICSKRKKNNNDKKKERLGGIHTPGHFNKL